MDLTSVAVEEVRAEAAEVPSPSQRLRLGLQAADRGHAELGGERYTAWSDSSGGSFFSGWATDSDGRDPDSLRIHLQVEFSVWFVDTDLRVCLEASDGNATLQFGKRQCTPWASQYGGWSEVVSDADGRDPDAYRITVETRLAAPGHAIRDFRLGLRGYDGGGAHHAGEARYTPWARRGGGWSRWATDDNGYNPDGFALHLDVKL
ncbi:hypothetical protein [Chondromyces crocatus]|uniref:hypothetical protein n=1 Tax=Chondromyces crocatus TaxID=52 RepID=UPI0012E1DBA8|nr:hypothetical protein [Chondromyces crocatus]